VLIVRVVVKTFPQKKQTGQSSVEYLAICGAIALALGVGMTDDTSVLKQFMDALATGYKKISFAISIPY
jgi:hypothetical protein